MFAAKLKKCMFGDRIFVFRTFQIAYPLIDPDKRVRIGYLGADQGRYLPLKHPKGGYL